MFQLEVHGVKRVHPIHAQCKGTYRKMMAGWQLELMSQSFSRKGVLFICAVYTCANKALRFSPIISNHYGAILIRCGDLSCSFPITVFPLRLTFPRHHFDRCTDLRSIFGRRSSHYFLIWFRVLFLLFLSLSVLFHV